MSESDRDFIVWWRKAGFNGVFASVVTLDTHTYTEHGLRAWLEEKNREIASHDDLPEGTVLAVLPVAYSVVPTGASAVVYELNLEVPAEYPKVVCGPRLEEGITWT